jgi:hypothetical protein
MTGRSRQPYWLMPPDQLAFPKLVSGVAFLPFREHFPAPRFGSALTDRYARPRPPRGIVRGRQPARRGPLPRDLLPRPVSIMERSARTPATPRSTYRVRPLVPLNMKITERERLHTTQTELDSLVANCHL